jgi:hypothetical protein
VFLGWSTSSPLSTKGFDLESKSVSNNVRPATLKVALTSYSPEIPLEHPNIPEFNRERERERKERKRESVVLSELHLLRPPLDCSHF